MSGQKQIIYLPLILLLISSCRPARQVTSSSAGEPAAQAYIDNYKDIAISEMKRTGVPASITLAQGMIESDYGRSRLAREANNHFGIKCHDDWDGPTISQHDDRRNECFRKYKSPEDSFYDHSDFLRSGSRYKSLFDLNITDYKGWAHGLKKAGYATNPDYAGMIIRKIEEMSLYNYDIGLTAVKKKVEEVEEVEKTGRETAAVPSDSLAAIQSVIPENKVVPAAGNRILENNRIQYIIVVEGESREMIEKQFRLLKWELPRYNELDENFVPSAGQMLYLQPKRDKAEPGKEKHIVNEGETIYSISQLYGIKESKLYELNRMAEGEEPAPGSTIWLRVMKPVR